MTFEEWANQRAMSGMEMEFARDAWIAATNAEREACVVSIKNLLDSHCAATGDCAEGCDFVTAWETAIDELRKRSNAI